MLFQIPTDSKLNDRVLMHRPLICKVKHLDQGRGDFISLVATCLTSAGQDIKSRAPGEDLS